MDFIVDVDLEIWKSKWAERIIIGQHQSAMVKEVSNLE